MGSDGEIYIRTQLSTTKPVALTCLGLSLLHRNLSISLFSLIDDTSVVFVTDVVV